MLPNPPLHFCLDSRLASVFKPQSPRSRNNCPLATGKPPGKPLLFSHSVVSFTGGLSTPSLGGTQIRLRTVLPTAPGKRYIFFYSKKEIFKLAKPGTQAGNIFIN